MFEFDREKLDVAHLKNEIQRNLVSSATAYYRIGINEYLSTHQTTWENYQAAVGNLAISVEMMLKAFVANRCFRKLFLGLPDELDILLAEETRPPKSIAWRRFETALRLFEFKTIELDQAISLYYIYFPEQKTELRSYFTFLAATRNMSVHAALPGFQRYDLARVSYLAVKVMRHLQDEKVLLEPRILQPKTEEIVKQFDHDRVERVTKAIREAKEASKKLTHKKALIHISSSDFDQYVIRCPICDSDTVASGETEFEVTGDDNPVAFLTFLPNEFHCEDCGLKIDDQRDFSLAGLEYTYDRSDDLDAWAKKEGLYDYDPE
jgi:hypothetical protein